MTRGTSAFRFVRALSRDRDGWLWVAQRTTASVTYPRWTLSGTSITPLEPASAGFPPSGPDFSPGYARPHNHSLPAGFSRLPSGLQPPHSGQAIISLVGRMPGTNTMNETELLARRKPRREDRRMDTATVRCVAPDPELGPRAGRRAAGASRAAASSPQCRRFDGSHDPSSEATPLHRDPAGPLVVPDRTGCPFGCAPLRPVFRRKHDQ